MALPMCRQLRAFFLACCIVDGFRLPVVNEAYASLAVSHTFTHIAFA